jgi:hypothetical protein
MRTVLLFIFCFAISGLKSQNCLKIKIERLKKPITNTEFYFTEVIDTRSEKKSLGTVYTGNLNIARCAAFKKSDSEELSNFLQKTYTNKKAKKYIVKINDIYIAERFTKNADDVGKAFMELEFYRQDGETLTFIAKTTKEITESYPDVTYSHGNRLKRTLLLSVAEFESRIKSDSALFTLKSEKKDLYKNPAPPLSDSTRISLRIENRKEILKNNLSFNCHTAEYTKGIGLKYNLLSFSKKIPKLAAGPSIFWSYFTFNDNFKVPNDVVGLKYNFGNVGLQAYYRLNRLAGITLDLSFLLGNETITRVRQEMRFTGNYDPLLGYEYYIVNTPYTTRSTITGFQFEQGILLMDRSKTGFNFGISLFERSLDAYYYDADWGLKLNVGIFF